MIRGELAQPADPVIRIIFGRILTAVGALCLSSMIATVNAAEERLLISASLPLRRSSQR
jgi:hypothetical protein